MDGYIGVSGPMDRKGEGYISPKVQREAIERWPSTTVSGSPSGTSMRTSPPEPTTGRA